MQDLLPALAPIPPDLAALGATPAEIEAHVAGLARRAETPCGEGSLVWHIWGEGPPLVLLHGGYGSWNHWIRNVLPLARRWQVLAVDLPGLGESATPPQPDDPDAMAAIIVEGLHRLLPAGCRVDLVGFSFGGVLGGPVAVRLGPALRRFVIVGANGLGLPRAAMAPMGSWRRLPDRAARLAVHRQTLEVLMFADPRRIDPLALHLQERNAEAGRVRSPEISRTDVLRRSLPALRGRLAAIWGEQDNIARGALDARREVLQAADPALPFRAIPGAGHWVSYEAADDFNTILSGLLLPE
ncbi:alpha/beta fold hydrolase [Falsiroseomonas sp.]|uniref:alpha/beta fold hydrolase n=1 Tax=Falsiroseomonas sp. TaxID=2870721 RepID=UPI003566F29A